MLKNSTAKPDRTAQPQIPEKLVAAGFHALSDPLRIQILELLRSQELCVCDLCDRLGVPQSKLSFHLKTLKEAALVRSRQEGRWIYYSLNLAQFVALEEYLAEYRRFSQMLPARPCADRG
jgi:ArsR family transcriptional regulator